jgi:asparagine synthase (glutamine-hydrolysing)
MFFAQISPSTPALPPAEAGERDVPLGNGVVLRTGGDVSTLVDGRVAVIVAGAGRYRREFGAVDALCRTVLAAYRAGGTNAVSDVPGETSIAVVDGDKRCAVLATDRFATYPIAWRAGSDGIAFGDRADQVAAGSARDEQALLDYLYHHVIPAPRTVHRGVMRLGAGSRLVYEGGRPTVSRWWVPRFDEGATGKSFDALRTEFLQLVESAVARRATGSVGCFLSGGTDSSTVAGMLTKVTGQPARSYSIGFDAQGYDEMEYARIAARAYGCDHREYYMTPDDLVDAIPRVARYYDQPFGNSSAGAGYICAAKAHADGVETLLAGDGGDELFGGNSRYALQSLFHHYEAVPGPMKRVMEAVFADSPLRRAPLVRKIGGYIEHARVPLPARLQYYNLLVHLGVTNVLTPEFLAQVEFPALEREMAASFAECRAGSLLNRMLAYDWKYTLEDNDLPKVVGTTSLAGVRVAFPLLDDALLDFSLRLPPGMKLKGQKLRWFFKEALRGFLPDEIITKKKHGFGLPFGVWATRHPRLKAFASDTLVSLKKRGIVRPEFIDELLSKRLAEHPGFYGEAVWILMMLELWLGRSERTASKPERTLPVSA